MAKVKFLERAAVRGSRRHVLDWVELPGFNDELSSLISSTGAVITEHDEWLPRGRVDSREARLSRFGPKVLPEHLDWRELSTWWLKHPRGANTPNWDLAATCTVDGQRGLLLVEAKAHKNEMNRDGKSLASTASEHSSANHRQIGQAIDQARSALELAVPGVDISRDRCYQFSNRVAHAWWLAMSGLPVVLLYLGFLEDDNMVDVGEPFSDDSDWQRHFRAHVAGLWPERWLERWIGCGDGSMTLVVRSRGITCRGRMR